MKVKNDKIEFTDINASRINNSLNLKFFSSSRIVSEERIINLLFSDYPKILNKINALPIKINECSSDGFREVQIDNFFMTENFDELLPGNTELIKAEYEDDFLIIINKPKGVKIHPDSPEDVNTLSNHLKAYFLSKSFIGRRTGHVHRLDIGTSGLILFAKDSATQLILDQMLFNNEIKRTYMAKVHGIFKKNEGVINFPIGRDRHISGKYRVSATGKDALTHYKVISSEKNQTILELVLDTGRTHQIRVHLSHLNHAIIGDNLYGSTLKLFDGKGFCLDSVKLEFTHPYTLKNICVKIQPHF